MTNIEAMRKRSSTRTFSDKPLDNTMLVKIKKILEDVVLKTPMGSNLKFGYIPLDSKSRSESGEKIGTYGVVKNQQGYIYGICEKTADGYLDYSYSLQQIVIELTKLDIGSVWLGGTFNKKGLFHEVALTENENIPAIIPIGFNSGKIRISERIAHKIAGSKNRKPWDQLFFKDDFVTVLDRDSLGELFIAFDMVRSGPSSMNGQTWRLLKEKNNVHFYNYNKNTQLYQALDIGISMYQFEAATNELGIKGEFIKSDPKIETQSALHTYYVTFRMKR